jgi:Rad3-related DNA helicase
LSYPTGFGKSLVYMAAAEAMGGRYLIVTATKGLQEQLLRDFPHLVDVRGAANYMCLESGGTCADCRRQDEGGAPCPDCPYRLAVAKAVSSPAVLTNYAYWLSITRHNPAALGSFALIVCDEAHEYETWAINARTETLTWDAVKLLSLAGEEPMPEWCREQWAAWSREAAPQVGRIHAWSKRQQDNAIRTLRAFSNPNTDDSWFHTTSRGPELCPLRAAPFFPHDQAARIWFVSATVSSKTLETAGAKGITEITGPSSFHVGNRPAYSCACVPSMDRRSSAADQASWLAAIDQYLDARQDRKGVIHTVSFSRAAEIAAASRHRSRMIVHFPRVPVSEVVARYKKSPTPVILLSPSAYTGHDFPGDLCRFQIMAKIPFPVTTDPLYLARKTVEKDLGTRMAAEALAQAYGRGVRAADDWCEFFIADSHMRWFIGSASKYLPQYLKEAYMRLQSLPGPMTLTAKG